MYLFFIILVEDCLILALESPSKKTTAVQVCKILWLALWGRKIVQHDSVDIGVI